MFHARSRGLSWCLGLGLLGGLTATSQADLTHRYSFSDGATTKDSVGDADATLKGDAKVSGGKLTMENTDKTSGDDKLSYLEFSKRIIPKTGALTLEAWFDSKGTGDWSRVFEFGSTVGGAGNGYFFVTAHSQPGDSRAVITKADKSVESLVAGGPLLDDGKPHMVAVVVDPKGGKFHFYVDGKEAADAVDLSENTMDNLNVTKSWIGKSTFDADAGFTGNIDEFRVHDAALSAEQIAADFKAGPDTVAPAVTPTTGPTTAPVAP